MTTTPIYHRTLCDELLDIEEGLTAWELDFIESIDRQLDAGRALTEAQADKLEDIYRKRVR